MSEYYKFERCIVCRTGYNLRTYKGKLDVTMLLNSLYMAVMLPAEKRNEWGSLKTKEIAKYLDSLQIIKSQEKKYNSDSVVRYLRNSLAHFNIEAINDEGNVHTIKLKAIHPKTKFQQCTFEFTIKQLYDFTLFVISHVLGNTANDICNNCTYKDFLFESFGK